MNKIFSIILLASSIILGQINPSYINRIMNEVSVDSLKNHLIVLTKPGGHNSRITYTKGNDSATIYLYRYFSQFKNLETRLDTFYIEDALQPYKQKPLYNVEVIAKSKNQSNESFIIGAHIDCSGSNQKPTWGASSWDTITAPGADDNGTGLALIMEMARLIDKHYDSLNLTYNIKLVALNAEESGLVFSGHHYGSMHYAKNAYNNGEEIKGMISADMIGFNNQKIYQAFGSNGTSDWIVNKVKGINNKYPGLGFIFNNPPYPTGDYSDHTSFWNFGYDAILIIEHTWPWNDLTGIYSRNFTYHKSSDTVGVINFQLLTKATRLLLGASLEIITEPLSINNPNSNIVSSYNLSSYPNPFNPYTNIEYFVPSGSDVSLKVYDINGNEIAILVDEYKNEGVFRVQFNGANLSSGMYLARFISGNISKTIKMILIR